MRQKKLNNDIKKQFCELLGQATEDNALTNNVSSHEAYLKIMTLLKSITKDQAQVLIYYDDYKLFIGLCEAREIELIEQLFLDYFPNSVDRNRLIHSSNNAAFTLASGQNNTLLMRTLLQNSTDKKLCDLAVHGEEGEDTIFTNAAEKGNLAMMKLLVEVTPEPVIRSNMVHTGQNMPFGFGVSLGRTDIVSYIWDLSSKSERSDMVSHKFTNGVMSAASRGNNQMIDFLLALIPHSSERETIIQKVIHGNEDIAYARAAEGGYINAMRHLESLTPDTSREDMRHARKNYAFILAASNQEVSVLKYLLEVTEGASEKTKMICGDNDQAFKMALTRDTAHRGSAHTPKMEVKPEIIDFFFELDFQHFSAVIKTLNVTSKVASYARECMKKHQETHEKPLEDEVTRSSKKQKLMNAVRTAHNVSFELSSTAKVDNAGSASVSLPSQIISTALGNKSENKKIQLI